jgi:hypothetical protein
VPKFLKNFAMEAVLQAGGKLLTAAIKPKASPPPQAAAKR